MKNIYIKESGIDGKGVFAQNSIKKGETIFILKGKKMKWKITDEASSQYGPNWVGIGKNIWLDVVSPGVFTNHSCNPNSGIKGKVTIVALKNINKDEEITIDYSITEIDKLWHMKCSCGEKNCRKEIKSIQNLPKRIIEKYSPYIPTYFKKIYDRETKK